MRAVCRPQLLLPLPGAAWLPGDPTEQGEKAPMACTLISETCPYKQKVLHWSLITPVRIITTFSIVPKVAAFAAAQKQAVAMFGLSH